MKRMVASRCLNELSNNEAYGGLEMSLWAMSNNEAYGGLEMS